MGMEEKVPQGTKEGKIPQKQQGNLYWQGKDHIQTAQIH